MKSHRIHARQVGLAVLAVLFCAANSTIIRSRGRPDIHLKVYHKAPERSLRQVQVSKQLGSNDYSFDDDVMEITKKQFMNSLNLKKHMNIHKPLDNLLARRRLEGLPPIQDDFQEKMTAGIESACEDCTTDTKGNVTTVTHNDQPVLDITLTVRKPDPSKKEDHNVVITIDNYKYTGDFDKKKMEGLAIIEDADNHRNEIDSFIAQTVTNFLSVEDENEEKSANGLKTVGDGLAEILQELDGDIKQVGGDENSGYVFEKRSDEGIILALIMAYSVGDELYEIRMKTRAMDEFEMQVREYLREEDKTALNTQIGEILKSEALGNPPKIEALAQVLNGLVKSAMGNKLLTEACEPDIEYKTDFLEQVPNTVVLNADAGGGDMGFDFGGEEDSGDQGPPKVCMFQSSHLSLLETLEMPYVFFSFRNSRVMVEHFIPAIDMAQTDAALKNAFDGIVSLNEMIEGKVKENMDEEGNAIENPKEFKIEELVAEIDKVASKLKLKKVDEGEKKYWKQGNVVRVYMSEVNGGFKVNFNFPHRLFKDKDNVKPITNEFIFKDQIAYDAVAVFSNTLKEFEAAMQEVNRH